MDGAAPRDAVVPGAAATPIAAPRDAVVPGAAATPIAAPRASNQERTSGGRSE